LRLNPSAKLADVQVVYEGIQAQIYELFMGQQIHIGGFRSTMELADLARIAAGDRGVELCCGSGASMRALVRFRDVASMVGVEAARAPVERGRRSVENEELSARIRFVIGDASATGLPDEEADFVWGEDAWCYVADKATLIAEAVRLTRPGGVIAFTDWVEGPTELTAEEADHVLQLMTFPSLETIDGYRSLFESQGCDVVAAEDTGRFGQSFKLYAEMLERQFAFDGLEILGFSPELFEILVAELKRLSELGQDRKLAQGRIVARRRS
jgi:ubiquinone/menaquinone biosynthesis C-methylase UbiE